MKFVASRDFFNASELSLAEDITKAAGSTHPLLVKKGTQFTVGGQAETVEGMAKPDDRKLATKLIFGQCAVIDNGTPKSKDAIRKINEELAADKKADEAAKANAPKSLAVQVAEAVVAALAANGASA